MSESASNLRRESVDLITSQLSQSLADSIEEAVNKSNNHFEFIPEIIRESHSCMCNTRKLMSILGQDSVSSERQNAGEPIVASRPADANIQSSSSTPVAPGSSSSSSSISIAHSIASGSSCYTDPCSPLETIRLLMKTASQEKSVLTGQRHRPIIVVGPAGVGKSSLLSQVYTYCSEWLSSDSQVIKVVRHIGQSPSSSYTSELIRSLCIDITLVYGFEMRTDIVYELSSLSLWFHDLLKQIETTCPTNDLVIVLDDLHLLKSLQTSTILGWLPWTLPPSVHLICSVTEESDAVVSLLKSRIPSDNVIKLTPLESTAKILSMILCRLRGYTSIVDQQSDIPDQPSSKPNETLLPEKVWHLLSERFNAIVKTNPVTPLYVSLLTDTLLVPLICTPNSSEPSTRPSNLPGQEVTPSSGSSHATDSTSQTTEVNLKMSDIPITIDELIEKTVDELQKSFPCSTIDRLLTYLSGTRYGLREEELIDLIGNGDETGNNNKHDSDRKQSTCESENDSSDKNNETCSNVKEDNNLLSSLHQFESNSIWPAIKAKLNPFLKEYFILGRPYIHWSHRIICETIKQRYIVDTFDYKTIHSKLADAFLLGFNEVLSNRDPQDKIYRNDSSDMLREIDELWFHLLSCEDIYKLKHNALLNIDFMMSAVQSSSISYYRSVLELVRGKIIDWEVDLLYHMTKQSVNIVSQNTDQLSIEILLWLRPFAAAIADSTSGLCINQLQLNYPNKDSLFSSSNHCDQMADKESHSNAINVKTNASKNINNSLTSSTLSPINRFAESKYLENLVRDTVNWCARYSGSLLIPINSWLHLPLPMQVSVISCPYAITRATLTNDHQNLIFCNKRSIHFFNLASKTLLKSVQGHRETITCLDISSSGRYLVTGSEDTSVILWEIDADGEIECNSRYSLGHHVAGVLCTAITHNEEYILSGSEIGAICVVRLDSGLLIGRLEHHRGMITCIKVNLEDDIFAAGSTDCSVSIWSLDTFCVLNQIFLPKAILHMDISMDSTFLMLALEDNKVHIRALTTGSEVHILQEHQSNSIVSYVKFAEDSSRAILGTGDGKLHIYDVHSAHLIQTLTSHQDMITSIISQPCDKYLVTCGTCKVIIWNFYPRKKVDSSLGASSGPVTNLYATLGNPNNYSSSTNNLTSSANNVSNVLVNSSNETSNTVINSSTNNVNNVSNIVMSNNNSTTATNMNNNNNNSNNFTNNTSNNDNIMNTATSTVNNNGINSNYNVTSISSNNNTVNVISVSNGSNMGVNSVCRSSVSRTTSNRTDHESSNKSSRSSSLRVKKFDQHKDPITCLAVSRDGTYAVTGSRDSLVKVWNLSSGETHATLSGHSAPITCVSFSPNGFFCVSGSEDKTVRVWSLTLGLKVFVYPDHSAAIDSVFVSTDSRRILSIDCQGFHRLWQADSGNTLVNVAKLTNKVTMFGNTVFAVGGKNDNSLRYWSVYEPDLEKSVSHSEPITCYTCTYDCSTIITGSQDMSLKVWEVSTGKLTQVLVGHEEPISCVSSAPMVQSMVVSGSQDCNLIVWDTTTGNVTFTLTGHTATILSVQLSIDGRVAVSASEDNTIMAWNALETGQRIALVDIHHTISSIGLSLSLNQIVVQLKNNNLLPIIKFHNNPAKTLDLPPPGTPSNEDKFSSHLKGFLTGSNRRLIGRGNLKREQSFDSFCWDQLHRGVSIDDFRKISALQQTTGSPLGSREHLATTGIIWDGASGSSVASGVTSVTDRNINRLLRLSNKPAGPKQKMLKKQQSMFAFFPEHSPPPVTASTLVSGPAIGPVAASLRGPSPLVSSTVSSGSSNPHTSGTLSGLPDSLSRSLIKQASPIKVTTSRGPPSRSQSLEDTQTGPVNTASTLAHQTEPATSKAQDK